MAGCDLSAVYNNNMAANRAEPSFASALVHFPERTSEEAPSQPAHSQASVCAALKANQSLAPRQDAEELDSVCTCASDPPGRISDCEQQGGNNRLSKLQNHPEVGKTGGGT